MAAQSMVILGQDLSLCWSIIIPSVVLLVLLPKGGVERCLSVISLQSLLIVWNCSLVKETPSLRQPKLVLGHKEPLFSGGKYGCFLEISCLRSASAGGKPL